MCVFCFGFGFFFFLCVHVCERLTLLLACVVRQVLVSCFRLLLSRLTQPAVAVQANTHAEKNTYRLTPAGICTQMFQVICVLIQTGT